MGRTDKVAAHCSPFPSYCSLRGMWQIYGLWEESSNPTITPGSGIKLTICNLNHLTTLASREKRHQPGQGLEEINSQILSFSSLILTLLFCLSPDLLILQSHTGWTLYSLTLLHSPHFTSLYTYALFLISDPLSFNTLTTYLAEISII